MSVNCSNKAASIPNILRGGIAKYHFIAALTALMVVRSVSLKKNYGQKRVNKSIGDEGMVYSKSRNSCSMVYFLIR